MVPRLPGAVRPGRAGPLRRVPRLGRLRRRHRPPAGGVRRVRPLPALVAIRLDPRHLAGGARGHRRCGRGRRRPLPLASGRRLARAARRGRDRLAVHARVRHRRAPRGTDADRAPGSRPLRRPRPGGADHRRRRRRAAHHPRDAEDPATRLHSDRPHRRRPAQEEHASARSPRPRHDRPATASALGEPPGRGDHRHSVRNRTGTAEGRQRVPRCGRAGEDAPGRARAHHRRPQPVPPAPRGAGRGHSRARGRQAGHSLHRLLHQRVDRARDGCRRIHRLGALPPGSRSRRWADRARRPLRERALQHRPRAPARAALSLGGAGPGRREGPGQDPPPLRAPPADGRLPRRRVQARPHDGGQPARIRPEQRPRDEGVGRARRGARCAAVRPRVDRQGRPPEERPRSDEGDLRVGRAVGRRARRQRRELHRRSLRKRARLLRAP